KRTLELPDCVAVHGGISISDAEQEMQAAAITGRHRHLLENGCGLFLLFQSEQTTGETVAGLAVGTNLKRLLERLRRGAVVLFLHLRLALNGPGRGVARICRKSLADLFECFVHPAAKQVGSSEIDVRICNILELEGSAGELGGLGICGFKDAQLSHFAESEGDYLLAGGSGSRQVTSLCRRLRSGKSPIKFVEWGRGLLLRVRLQAPQNGKEEKLR